jgi:hypothetical protein
MTKNIPWNQRSVWVLNLVRLAKHTNAGIRLAACKEILDRGIGRASQPLTSADGQGPVQVAHEVKWQGWNPGEPNDDHASYEEWKAAKEAWLNNPNNAHGRCYKQYPGPDPLRDFVDKPKPVAN